MCEPTISWQVTVKWCQKFEVRSMDKHPKGRFAMSSTTANVDHVNEIIGENCQIKLQEMARRLNISFGNVFSIVQEDLGIHKLYRRWIPCGLTDYHKQECFQSHRHFCNAILQRGMNFCSGSLQGMKHGSTTLPLKWIEHLWNECRPPHHNARTPRSNFQQEKLQWQCSQTCRVWCM